MTETTNQLPRLAYTPAGDYLIPDLALQGSCSHSLGKYGRLRKAFLQEHRPILWNQLILSEQLYPHLQEVDRTATARMEQSVRELAQQAGATEALKERDPMEWVRLMNLCQVQVEESVMAELVCC